MRIPVVGLGAGGHARVVIEAVRFEDKYDLVGMLDRNPELTGKDLLGVPILGTDDILPKLIEHVSHFFVGVASTGPVTTRLRLYEMAVNLGMQPIDVIHPSAIVSRSATYGAGITVLAGAIINACVALGTNTIVNTGAIIEHDSIIGDHVHVATGACLCGGVHIGRETHVGAGATILQGVKVGDRVVVGAGAVVIRDVPPGVTVVGVPARVS